MADRLYTLVMAHDGVFMDGRHLGHVLDGTSLQKPLALKAEWGLAFAFALIIFLEDQAHDDFH